MTNKMVVRDLFYTQGTPSYSDSAHQIDKLMKKIIFPSLRLIFSNQAVVKIGTILSKTNDE